MPRGADYVSPGQRARNERDSGDPDRNSDDERPVETSPESMAASSPDDGRRKNMRKMPTLPGTPADDAAPFLDDVADEVLQKDLSSQAQTVVNSAGPPKPRGCAASRGAAMRRRDGRGRTPCGRLGGGGGAVHCGAVQRAVVARTAGFRRPGAPRAGSCASEASVGCLWTALRRPNASRSSRPRCDFVTSNWPKA